MSVRQPPAFPFNHHTQRKLALVVCWMVYDFSARRLVRLAFGRGAKRECALRAAQLENKNTEILEANIERFSHNTQATKRPHVMD